MATAKRPWAVSAVGYLLIGQAVGSLALGYWLAEGWLQAIYGLIAVLAAVAAFSFLRVLAAARLLGMTVQGSSLLFALTLYFVTEAPWYVYVMMAYGIVMVLYLNSAGVVRAFRPRDVQSWGGTAR